MENPFRFFGITPNLILEQSYLRGLLIEIQKRAQLDTEEGEMLAEHANIAYKNLLNPESRVIHFIQYYKPDFPWASEKLDGSELMEYMDLSDQIETAILENSDDLKQSLHSELERHKDQLVHNLTQMNISILSNGNLEKYPFKELALWVHRYKYYLRLKKNLEGEIEI